MTDIRHGSARKRWSPSDSSPAASLAQAQSYGITTIVAPQTGVDELPAFARARDDAIEAHTAAMLAPYSDKPEGSGETFYSPEAFNALVARLDASGYQLFVHSIGDRGIRTALDAFEYAREVNGERDSRHQLVHVEVVSPQDIPRFRQLDVVACM